MRQRIRDTVADPAVAERLLPRDYPAAEALGERPQADVVIAEHDGRPAGFALFFHNFSTFRGRRGLYLEDLFVRPEFRKHGLGRQLLAHLASIAVNRGCGRMEWSVLNWNETALKVYRAIGATPMTEWTVQRLTGDALEALAATDTRP